MTANYTFGAGYYMFDTGKSVSSSASPGPIQIAGPDLTPRFTCRLVTTPYNSSPESGL